MEWVIVGIIALVAGVLALVVWIRDNHANGYTWLGRHKGYNERR